MADDGAALLGVCHNGSVEPALGTMDSVRAGPFGQLFRPDNFVFGQTGQNKTSSQQAHPSRMSYESCMNTLIACMCVS